VKNQNVTATRYSWRLTELPPVTRLSLPFWRKVVRLKKIPAKKVEGAVIILDGDLRAYLEGSMKEEEADASAEAK